MSKRGARDRKKNREGKKKGKKDLPRSAKLPIVINLDEMCKAVGYLARVAENGLHASPYPDCPMFNTLCEQLDRAKARLKAVGLL